MGKRLKKIMIGAGVFTAATIGGLSQTPAGPGDRLDGFAISSATARNVIPSNPIENTQCDRSLGVSLKKNPAPADKVAIDLVTINIQGLPGAFTREYPRNRGECMKAFLDQFDVALIQEAFDTSKVSINDANFVQTWRPVFGRGGLVGVFCGKSCARPGLMMASRVEMTHPRTVPYSVCSGWRERASDCFSRKGVQVARIGEITIINTHMDAGRHKNDHAARAQQLRELREMIPANGDVIVAGDLNMKPEDQPMMDAFLRDTGFRVVKRDRVDFVLVRGDGIEVDGAAVINTQSITDHNAIAVRFMVPRHLIGNAGLSP